MSDIPFFDYKRQYFQIKNECDSALERFFASGQLVLGPELERFENAFAEYVGLKHAIGVSSGTDAIYIALKASGIGAGDEVISVPNTAVPTVSAIRMCGALPVFVDVSEETGLMDVSMLESVVSSRTKAVIPVHLYGGLCDREAIYAFAARHSLRVIEDCAQASGSWYKPASLPVYGDIACFSFYPTKNLGAFGDAGAILTDDAALAGKIRQMRFYGFDSKRNSTIEGVNGRMDEIQAALLNVKMPYLSQWISRRRELAGMYRKQISNPALVMDSPGENSSYHLFLVRSAFRDALAAYLASHGIGTAVHYSVPVHLMEAYSFLRYGKGAFPIAEKRAGQILSLPFFPELQDSELLEVSNSINSFTP